METIYFTGIDQHKRTSFLTTLDQDGSIVRSTKLKNNPEAIRAYFGSLKGRHQVTVETSTGWYWMSDLLASYPTHAARIRKVTPTSRRAVRSLSWWSGES